jgi:LysM repeat protein
MDQKFYKLKALVFAIAIASLTACSSSQVGEDGEEIAPEGEYADGGDMPAEQGGTDEVPNMDPVADMEAPPMQDPNMGSEPPPMEGGDMAQAPAPDSNMQPEDPAAAAPMAQEPMSQEPVAQAPVSDAAVSGDASDYKVQKGDTLMKIAFEQYGDIYRWREIYESNRAVISNPNAVPPGTQLKLVGAGMVSIERNGEQYFIKSGDTLGSISNNVYGTKTKWKRLWENNRQLIKDPNKIYAGFYLYYLPEGRLTQDPANGESGANAGAPASDRTPASTQ